MKADTTAKGRRTKLNPHVKSKIVAVLQAGNFTTVAVEYAGIGRATFYRWMNRGREDQEGIYCDFYKAVRRAIATAEVRAVTILRRHMATSWKACMVWLERRFPQRWAVRRRPDLDMNPHQVLAELLGISELELLEIGLPSG